MYTYLVSHPKIIDIETVICLYFEDFTRSISLGGSMNGGFPKEFNSLVTLSGETNVSGIVESRKHSNGSAADNLCVEIGGFQLPCLIPKLDVVNISCIICSGSIFRM